MGKVVLVILAIFFATSSTAIANMVLNGGFETGTLENWTQSGTGWYVISNDPNQGGTPYDGNFNATTTNWATDWQYIRQEIKNTTVGQSYTVGFWLASADSYPANEFVAQWNGVTKIQLVNLTPPESGYAYAYYSYTAIAEGELTTISFGYLENPAWFDLDNVSMNPVPIPGAVWLLGSGLLGLVALKRRFQR